MRAQLEKKLTARKQGNLELHAIFEEQKKEFEDYKTKNEAIQQKNEQKIDDLETRLR